MNTHIVYNNLVPFYSDLPRQDKDLFQLEQFALFDSEQGLKHCGSYQLLNELLRLMAHDLTLELTRMQAAFSQQDYSLIEKIAHKIKGAAVYVGTIRLKYACQYLERYWKSGQRELFEQLYHQAVSTIEDTCQCLKKAIL